MSELRHQVRRAISESPATTVRRVLGRLRRAGSARLDRWRDRTRTTYADDSIVPGGSLTPMMDAITVELDETARRHLDTATRLLLEHRVDLLGSGWVRVHPGMTCGGVNGHRFERDVPPATATGADDGRRSNLGNARVAAAARELIADDYRPIDWHLDFKSGYRWDEAVHARALTFGDVPGADVKVPWELGRLQHLPQLALAAMLRPDAVDHGGTPFREACPQEIRNQLLDFEASNPPRYGVNWVCTMDVAIRAANIAVTMDLLRASGWTPDRPFGAVVTRMLIEHGEFITAHLEWGPGLRSNHYLANIAGLVVAAAALPTAPLTDAWLAFGLQELIAETLDQFLPDGGNFEASANYHRLSAEMVLWATAVTLAVPEERMRRVVEGPHPELPTATPLVPRSLELHRSPLADRALPFPPQYLDRLVEIERFTQCIGGVCGVGSRVGDDDSGRFLKLQPAWRSSTVATLRREWSNLDAWPEDEALQALEELPVEDQTDHRHLLDGFRALGGGGVASGSIDALLVETLRRRAGAAPAHRDALDPRSSFPEFGLDVLRAGPLTAILRCGSIGQRGNGGHAHNDQLAMEVLLDGQPFLVDPGTGLYTPDHELRNTLRSTAAHCTIAPEGLEQNPWNPGRIGLFSMSDDRSAASVEHRGDGSWTGVHHGFGEPHRRTVVASPSSLAVTDELALDGERSLCLVVHPDVRISTPDAGSTDPVTLTGRAATTMTVTVLPVDGDPPRGRWVVDEIPFSPAYGWVRPTRRLRFVTSAPRLHWRLDAVDRAG